uniref:Uncharacterized protein n=1 Tax=viral metagenome TaxID=1070528 RepID=A0A6C0JSW9_9ZZZZ
MKITWIRGGKAVLAKIDGIQDTTWHTRIKETKADFTSVLVAWEAVGVLKYKRQYKNNKGQIGRLFCSFKSRKHLYDFMRGVPPRSRCFHEVIPGARPQKFYMDIDVGHADMDRGPAVLEEARQCLMTVFEQRGIELKESDVKTYTSHGDTKFSAHLVVQGYMSQNRKENYYTCYSTIQLMSGQNRGYIDLAIYNDLRSLRIYRSHKAGSPRIKICEGEEDTYEALLDSLVTYTDQCIALDCVAPEEFTRTREAPEIPEGDVQEYVEMVEARYGDVFEYRDCKDGYINFKRLAPSMCEACGREHEAENPRVYIDEDGSLVFDCRRGPRKTVLKSNVRGTSCTAAMLEIYGNEVGEGFTPILLDDDEEEEEVKSESVPVVKKVLTSYGLVKIQDEPVSKQERLEAMRKNHRRMKPKPSKHLYVPATELL